MSACLLVSFPSIPSQIEAKITFDDKDCIMVHLHYYGHLSVRVLAIMGLGHLLILAFEASFVVVPHRFSTVLPLNSM